MATLPSSIRIIGDFAFANNENLITLDARGVKDIEEFAFSKCPSLVIVTFSDELQTIGQGAFAEDESLESFSLGHSLVSIGDSAFYKCLTLSTLFLPATVSEIGPGAFMLTPSLTHFVIDPLSDYFVLVDGMIMDKERTIVYEAVAAGYFDEIVVPALTLVIAPYAFHSTLGVTLRLPVSLQTIGEYAFYGMPNLEAVTFLGNNVTTLAPYTFADCDNLVTISIRSSLVTIDETAFLSSPLTTINYYGTEGSFLEKSYASYLQGFGGTITYIF
jgi:hypothetical protein